MCGIVGIVDSDLDASAAEVAIRRMLTTIRHRGPDQFGIYLGNGVALGNARLSIIDLEGGQQPIGNEDGTLWIVFNGEIFNYVELRAELEARGHQFRTHADTEVILHLYEDFGPACLSRLNGQFAIAIFNEHDRSLFLARDRLGVRPLYYAHGGNRLLFGSEIKALLTYPGLRAELDPVALEQIFTYWSTLSPRTCFRGIVSLPPGHYLVAKSGEYLVKPYWQLTFPAGQERVASTPPKATAAYVEELRSLLADAVKIRLRADVPVGAYLSGGLDSSLIAAIIRSHGISRLDTFSIAFSDPQFDESEHQRRMARFLGTEHQVVHATHADIGRVFPEVVWHTETPLTRTAPAPMFLLSKLVHDRNYKVVLTGEGADEFLAGYDIFKEAAVRRFWARQPNSYWRSKLLGRLYPDIARLGASGAANLKAFFGFALEETDRADYSHSIRWRNNRRACRFFSDDLRAAIRQEQDPDADELRLPPEFKRWGPLEQAQYLEISIFLSQYLLSSQGDRPAMAHSVEGRFPFLDHRVVEFCCRLPSRLKLNGLKEKYLLRQLAKESLPPDILARRKRPYRAPIHRSFFNEAPLDYVCELLDPAPLRSAGLFNPQAVTQLVAKVRQNCAVGETDDMALVGVLSTQLVHQQFIKDHCEGALLSNSDSVKVVDRRAPAAAHPLS